MKLIVLLAAFVIVPFPAHADIVPRKPPSGGIVDVRLNPGDRRIGRELRGTRDTIDEGRKQGDLSKREARALRREARQIGTLADRYGQDGLSDSEIRELETRTRVLQNQVDNQRIKGPAGRK